MWWNDVLQGGGGRGGARKYMCPIMMVHEAQCSQMVIGNDVFLIYFVFGGSILYNRFCMLLMNHFCTF
jgi:hypothetical protein